MKIECFNTESGLYIFKSDDFDTEYHSHPAIEIIVASIGTFSVWTENSEHHGLKFALIKANYKHRLSATKGKFDVILVEHFKNFVHSILTLNDISTRDGFYFESTHGKLVPVIYEMIQRIKECELASEYDERIFAAIQFLNKNDLEYSLMLKTLQRITNLSESRLSHLFKTNLGISIKKYLVWNRLKSTIYKYLNDKDDLFTSLIKSGFYDQPHFSKNFKAMLGVKASKAYNSRTLQVSTLLKP